MNKKIQRHHNIVLRLTIIPIIIVIIIGGYSYYNDDILDEDLLTLIINNIFLPLYTVVFGVIFGYYLETEDEKLYPIYKYQLLMISLGLISVIMLKFVFKDIF